MNAALAGEQLLMIDGGLGNTLPATWTQPAGMTKPEESPSASMVSLAISHKPLSSAGATGNQTATFSRVGDLTGIQIALKQPPPAIVFFHQDQLGSTRLLTDTSGTVVGRYTFDAYGNTTAKDGAATTPLQYAGQYTDTETGLQYLLARYYDPTTGQFLSVDPDFSATRSRYGYVAGDPLNLVDPTGMGINLPWGWCIHIPLTHDSCDNLWGLHPAIRAPLVAVAAAGAAVACVFGGCEAAAAAAVAKAGSFWGWLTSLFESPDAALCDQAAYDYATTPNNLDHLFAAKHGFEVFVQQFGSREAVVRQFLDALKGLTPSSGVFEIQITVAGQPVMVTGNVINGVVKIGSAWRPSP